MASFLHVLVVTLVTGLVLGALSWRIPHNGRHMSLDWNRRNGKYRVLYPDGNLSQPFTRGVAKDYAEIFGGKVVSRDYKSP